MAYYFAHWLEPALRSDPFVAERLVLAPGWEGRGRPPSQFSFLPSGTVDHHTACMIRDGHDPQQCANGIIAGREGAPGPISQLLGTFTPPGVRWNGHNADPRIMILAAGRANHAGTGEYPWGAPGGNGSSIGLEWCGPPTNGWPDIVIELRARVTSAILRWNGWGVHQSTIHWEYARPLGRKIDPSGAWHREPHLGQLGHWNPDLWRAEVGRYINLAPVVIDPQPQPTPTPQPNPSEDDMAIKLLRPVDCDAQFLGMADRNGNLIEVVWADKQRADAHIAAGATIDDALSLGGLSNCVLLGPLPVGDTRHQWTGAEFFRVVG